MRGSRVLLVLVVFVLLAGAVAMPVTAAEAAVDCAVGGMSPIVTSPSAAGIGVGSIDFGEELFARPEVVPAASPAVPPCPQLRGCPVANACGGSNPCQLVGFASKVDTGDVACDAGGGQILVCAPGTTIHIKTQSCGQCPCCTQSPACFCPLDCGSAIFGWGCA